MGWTVICGDRTAGDGGDAAVCLSLSSVLFVSLCGTSVLFGTETNQLTGRASVGPSQFDLLKGQ